MSPGDPCRGRHGFFSAPGVIGGSASVAAPSAFLPMLTLAPGGTLSQPALFQLTIAASGVAPGAYQLFGALVRVGAFLDNRIDPGDVLALELQSVTVAPLRRRASRDRPPPRHPELPDII